MSDSLKHKIFVETDCIPEQTMFDYIDKKLSAKECHAVEKHLLHCDLCSDALEGLELTKNRGRIAAINQKISERIASPIKENKLVAFNYKLIISIAASILLLIGGVFFFNHFNQKNEIAEFKSEPAISLPPSSTSVPIDETIQEKANTVTPGESKLEQTKETEVGNSGSLMTRREQESVPEGKLTQEQSVVASGAGAASRVSDVQSEIVQSEENVKAVPAPAPAKSSNSVSQNGFQKDLKDDSDEEQKKLEVITVASDEERLELAEPTISTALASQEARDKNDRSADSGEKNTEAKKSANTRSPFRAKFKENKSATRESAAENATGDIAYDAAPQSLVNDNQNAEKGTIVEVSSKQDQKVYEVVEQMPEFPGGQDSLRKFIHRNFKYPENSENERKSKSTIYVTFIVDKEGMVKQATIFKGINSELDKEAKRVVNKMPRWKPGKNNGETVAVRVNLPIKLD